MFNFYRQFVPAAAKILRPLTDSTQGSPKATTALEWTPLMEVAALLEHPQQDQELVVMVDVSANHVGAAALGGGGLQSLAFFSKKLEPAQMRYSAFDRELFTCVAGICHFCHMLEGGPPLHHLHRPQASDICAGQGDGAQAAPRSWQWPRVRLTWITPG